MDEYISRADALAAFEKVEDLYDPEWGNKRYTPDDVEEIINDVHAADVRPVARSKFELVKDLDDGSAWKCSNCNLYYLGDTPPKMNFCPICGADMTGGADNG